MRTLGRIRMVFLVLVVVLLLPLGLLLDRALDSMAAERELRHQALAERLFDEMERELSVFLRREEERPFEHYRFFYVPGDGGVERFELSRSPLARLPQEDFVLGYFQVDPDGTVSSPLEPENKELAEALAGWRASAEVDAAAARVRSLVERLWDSRSAATERVTDRRVSPGTTMALEREGRDDADVSKERVGAGYSPGRALSDLNRGAASRQERQTKVSKGSATQIYNFSKDEAENVLQQELFAQRALMDERETGETGRVAVPTGRIESAIEQALKATDSLDVQLEPMVGRLGDAEHLFLYRTVLIGSDVYRQGLVLHVPKLVGWLSAAVLTDSNLADHVRIALASREAEPGPPDQAGYLFHHRFAEPFAAVTSELRLDPLPEESGAAYVYWLAILLALAATLGLFALYRMVAVAVAYAERRHNFVSAVTHELKTPLTALRLHGEMLRDGVGASEEKRQKYYGVITAEAERLTRLVNNVLELARLERRERPLNMATGDVVAVVEEVVRVLGPHAEQQGFVLRVERDEDLPPVRFDRDTLLQVLFNLVDNAIKYSRHSEKKEIMLSCRKESGRVVLGVADRGPGVARRHLRRIFQPFYRAENELTRSSKGTGIGLALVRGLVERMGGSVSGSNLDSGGFVVSISLPASAPNTV